MWDGGPDGAAVRGAVAGALGAAGGLLARYLREDFRAWAAQVDRSGYCVRPVRIRGSADAVDTATGEVLRSFTTGDEPGGVLLVACGDRRSVICPPCAERYRADLWHVVAAGLRGRDGGSGPRSSASASVPSTVSGHPAVFATLTAPSFGRVHTIGRDGYCHPRRHIRPVCEHGTAAYCNARHAEGDRRLGEALCVSCYDYAGHILWHSSVPELWRRFVIEVPRAVSRLSLAHTGVHRTVRAIREELRISYVRVAEWQRRAAVHVHAVIRADGRGDDGEVVPPPGWMTRGLLEAAVRDAAAAVRVGLPRVQERVRWAVWGEQLDVKPITDARRTAAYLAKYSTKTASDTLSGWPVRAFDSVTIDRLRRQKVSWHLLMLAGTCLRLAALPECRDLRLAEHVHNLGYGGHYSSKSRVYSVTLKALGAARRAWRAEQRGADVWAVGSGVEVIGDWRLVGVGHATAGDALLAEQLARQEAAYREAVRLHDVRRLVYTDGEA